jgi:hypothetical protein
MVAKTSGITYCFLDTNVLLEFQTLDEVDWPAVLGAEEVCLVIAPVVLRELNNHKDAGGKDRLAQRARMILSKLSPWIESALAHGAPVEVRANVTLWMIPQEPILEWTTLGLDASVLDDRLIASILLFTAEKEQSERIVVASHDLLVRAKAMSHSIHVLNPEGHIQLLNNESPERAELARLRAEIEQLKNRIPKLNFGFIVTNQLSNNFTCADALITPLRRKDFPRMTTKEAEEQIKQAYITRDSLVEEGRKRGANSFEIGEFQKEYEYYLRALAVALRYGQAKNHGCCCMLHLGLDNVGMVMATQIRLQLRFPEGTLAYESYEDKGPYTRLAVLPHKPTIPWRHKSSIFDLGAASIVKSQPPYIDAIVNSLPAREQDGWEIDRDNRSLCIYLKSTLHAGRRLELEPLNVCFHPDITGGATIDYVIMAADLPTPVTKQLHIILEDVKRAS